MSNLFQEASASPAAQSSDADLVGLGGVLDQGLGVDTALGIIWLVFLALGTVAGPLTIFARNLSWPPKVLHLLIAVGAAGLAFSTWRSGLPPILDVDIPEAEPSDYAWGIQKGMIVLTQWMFLVSASGFALAFRAARLRERWRLAGYLLLIAPQLVFGLYGRGRPEEMWRQGPLTEEPDAFLFGFYRNQYLYTCAALAGAVLLFLVLDQVQRRRR